MVRVHERLSLSLPPQPGSSSSIPIIDLTFMMRQRTISTDHVILLFSDIPELLPGPRSVLGAVGSVALLPCGMRASPRVALRVAGAGASDRRVYGAARPHAAPPPLKLNVSRVVGAPLALAPCSLRGGSASSLTVVGIIIVVIILFSLLHYVYSVH